MVDITVAVCTWNRADLLAQMLARFAVVPYRSDPTWEILVVDNGSTDHTGAVLDRYRGSLPLRRVVEAQLGLSNARNCAIAEARGDLLLWTDDDVLVAPDWLRHYWWGARSFVECAFFGGTIRPWFEDEPPAWLTAALSEVRGAFAALEAPTGYILDGADVLPFGCNWGVRTEIQRRFPYDPQFGRRGESMIGGEETNVIRSLLRAGHKGRWVPEAVVQHWVPRSKQTVGYLRRYYRGVGATFWMSGTATGRVRLLGRPLWVWRQAVENELRYRVGRTFRPPAVWVKSLVDAAAAWGILMGE